MSLLATVQVATTTPKISPNLSQAITQEITTETIKESVDLPKTELTREEEEYLKKLEQCESGGSTTIRILDTNSEYSTGRYQFQDQTFLTYGQKYGLIATSTTEARPLIFDGDLQQEIAIRMLRAGEQKHWYNCTNKIGNFP